MTEVGHRQDLDWATGRVARLLRAPADSLRDDPSSGRDRSVTVCQEYGAGADEGADAIDVAIGRRVLGETVRQPDDDLDSQCLTQRVLDLLA